MGKADRLFDGSNAHLLDEEAARTVERHLLGIWERDQEIHVLKLELEEVRTEMAISIKERINLGNQLAEARAENERLTLENRQMLQGMKWDNQLKAIARQQTAREIIQYIEDQGMIQIGYDKTLLYEIDDSDITELKQRFGLEG